MKRHLSRPSLTLERGIPLLSSLRPPSASLPPSPDPNQSFSRPLTPTMSSPKMPFSSARTPLLPGPGWVERRRESRKMRIAVIALLAALAFLFWLLYPSSSLILSIPNATSTSFLSLLSNSLDTRPSRIPPSPWPPPLQPSPDTHYLTYHPHSGFHNQRIALENAFLLAALLNRTLLLPPARLGTAVRYMETPKLHRHLTLSSKIGLAHCQHFLPNTTEFDLPEECATYFSYSHVPFSSLLSLPPSSLTPSIALPMPVLLPDDLPFLSLNDSDTFALRDTHPYETRYYDSSLSTRPLGRYANRVNVDELSSSTRNSRLLSLGTLFGTSRIKLHTEPAKHLRRKIRESMTFSHPLLLSVTDKIVAALGGRDAYLGAHVRLGDGNFERDGAELVREIWWALVRSVGIADADAVELELWAHEGNSSLAPPPPLPDRDLAALRSPHPSLPPFPSPPPSPRPPLSCTQPLHINSAYQPLNTPLFLATPSASHPLLAPLLRTFPCAFTLDNLPDLLEPLFSPGLTSEEDGVPVGGWLVGFVDGLVVSSARHVVGTRGSTFSRWVEDVGWRRAHGFEIVDRG